MNKQQGTPKLKILQKSFQLKNSGYIRNSYTRADNNRLGAGGFGEVYRIFDKTSDQENNVKCLKKVNQQDRSQALNEINSLKLLSHPNILKFYEYFENQKNIFMVLEFIKGSDLIDYIQSGSVNLTEKKASTIMRQILEALAYTHEKNIVHRDIKCENIMIIDRNAEKKGSEDSQTDQKSSQEDESNCDVTVKLIDWGFSFNLGLFKKEFIESKTIMGTYQYISPEQVQQKNYNSKCDIWSAGVVLYCILTKSFPFFSYLKFSDKFVEYQQMSLSQFQKSIEQADTQSQTEANSNNKECSAQILISQQTEPDSNTPMVPNNAEADQNSINTTTGQQQQVQPEKQKHSKGKLLAVLQEAKMKFEEEKTQDLFNKILFKEPVYDDKIMSEEAIDLLRKMLNKNQFQRPSAKELLKHPWFQNSYNSSVENEKIKENLQKLKNFTYQNEFQMAVWMYISSHLVEDSDKKELEIIFKKLDKDSSGTLSKEEIKTGFQEMEIDLKDEDLDQIFDQIDSDKNGFIDYNEFLASTISLELISNQNYLKKVFNLIDVNKNGSISLDELKNILGSPDQRVNAAYQSVFEDIFSQIDINRDGEISYEEFEKLITSHIQESVQTIKNQNEQPPLQCEESSL